MIKVAHWTTEEQLAITGENRAFNLNFKIWNFVCQSCSCLVFSPTSHLPDSLSWQPRAACSSSARGWGSVTFSPIDSGLSTGFVTMEISFGQDGDSGLSTGFVIHYADLV